MWRDDALELAHSARLLQSVAESRASLGHLAGAAAASERRGDGTRHLRFDRSRTTSTAPVSDTGCAGVTGGRGPGPRHWLAGRRRLGVGREETGRCGRSGLSQELNRVSSPLAISQSPDDVWIGVSEIRALVRKVWVLFVLVHATNIITNSQHCNGRTRTPNVRSLLDIVDK